MGLQMNFVYLKYTLKILKYYAFLAKISNFGFDAQGITVVIEPLKSYKGVFFIYSHIFEEFAKTLLAKTSFKAL